MVSGDGHEGTWVPCGGRWSSAAIFRHDGGQLRARDILTILLETGTSFISENPVYSVVGALKVARENGWVVIANPPPKTSTYAILRSSFRCRSSLDASDETMSPPTSESLARSIRGISA